VTSRLCRYRPRLRDLRSDDLEAEPLATHGR
jgi:hypothetical protein